MQLPMSARPPRSASPQSPPRNFLAEVRTTGSKLPSRGILHGVEGIGKTTFGAYAPNPIFLMSRGETGLTTLIDAGRLPEVAHLPELTSWLDVLGAVQSLTLEPHEYRTVILDALGGFERLCHEYICESQFAGDWGERGFASYGKGYDVSVAEWLRLLAALDRLREQRRVGIIMLAHTKVKAFRNPTGADFDRYTVDAHEKTWGVSHKWADFVGFANYYIDTKKDGGRAKGIGGTDRVLYTERTAAWDAKNRHGLPAEIDMGTKPEEAWSNFAAAMRAARSADTTANTANTEAAEVTQ